MADTDLTVRFGGDTTGLNASVNAARQALAAFSPAASGQAKVGLDALASAISRSKIASDIANASWRENLISLAALESATRTTRDAYESYAASMLKAQAAAAGWIVQQERLVALGTVRLLVEAPSAVMSYAEALAHGTDAARSFIHEQEGISGSVGRAVVAVRGFFEGIRIGQTDLARTTLQAIAAAGGMKAFQEATAQSGVGMKDAIQGFLVQLTEIPGMTDAAAKNIEAMLGAIPNYSAEANAELIKIIATISATGDEAVANAKKITDALKNDSAAGGATMAAAVGALVDGLAAAGLKAEDFKARLADVEKTAATVGNLLQPAAASAFYDAILARLRQQHDLQKTITDANAAALAKEGVLGQAISFARQATVDAEKERLSLLERQIGILQQEKAVADGITAARSREDTFRDTLDKSNPLNDQIEEVTSKIAILQNKLNRGSGDTPTLTPVDIATLVRTVAGEAGGESTQGQLAVAAVALNRLANGNFGDSLEKVLKAGNGSQFNVWKPGDPTGKQNLATDSAEYQRILREVVEPLTSGKTASPVGDALNFYNPKTTPEANRFAMDDRKTIGRHDFGTAKNSPEAIDPLDDDEVESTTQSVQKLQDELRRLNELKAGGSATSRVELETAQAQARGIEDQVGAAKRLVAAKQEELDTVRKTGSTPQAEDAAARALAQAQTALRAREGEQSRAAEALKTAQTQEGSRERLDATLAALDAQGAGYPRDSAKWLELEKQKLEATRTYGKQVAAEAAELEQVRHDAAKRGLKEESDQVKENARLRSTTAEEEEGQLLAIQRREAAEDRRHFQERQRIFADQPKERMKAGRELAQVDARELQQSMAAQRNYLAQLQQSYRETFDQIGANISQSIMGMLERQTTFRQAMQSLAREVVQMFIQSRIRMVADWAAGQAANTQAALTNQATQTAAVTAGEASRTAATAAGAAAGFAAKAPAITASIGASANEAYAGTYGFLSPVMGPLAAAPAAAAAALVMAKAALPSFAVGHMNLPSDMVAQLHAGEMIVPASPAAALRDMMAGGGAASGGETGMPNISVNVTSFGSRSEKDIKADARVMIREIQRDMMSYPVAWKQAMGKHGL